MGLFDGRDLIKSLDSLVFVTHEPMESIFLIANKQIVTKNSWQKQLFNKNKYI